MLGSRQAKTTGRSRSYWRGLSTSTPTSIRSRFIRIMRVKGSAQLSSRQSARAAFQGVVPGDPIDAIERVIPVAAEKVVRSEASHESCHHLSHRQPRHSRPWPGPCRSCQATQDVVASGSDQELAPLGPHDGAGRSTTAVVTVTELFPRSGSCWSPSTSAVFVIELEARGVSRG